MISVTKKCMVSAGIAAALTLTAVPYAHDYAISNEVRVLGV
jgi:hypothetical protein